MMEVESTEPTVTVSRIEAEQRTARIRGKLADALDDLVEAFFDGVHTALGYESWDEYVAGEFGDLRFKVAAVERGERVRELRGRGMPVKVAADLFGVTERTVKRDSAEGTNVPTAKEVEASIKSAVNGMVTAREDIREALSQYPGLHLPDNILPPKMDDVGAELMSANWSRVTLLVASIVRGEALAEKFDSRVQEELRIDLDRMEALSERMKAAHYAARFLGREEDLESMAEGMGIYWSDVEGHYIDRALEDAE